MKMFWVVVVAVISVCFLGSTAPLEAADQTIKVQKLTSAPTVDGNAEEWQQGEMSIIPVTGKLGIKQVAVQAGVYGDTVYFLWQWQDSTEDIEHRPYIWDPEAEKYVAGPQEEDRFAVNFAMVGDFTHDWLSGQIFKADMWHWKAYRSNTIGLAHDKMTIITSEPAKDSYKTTAKNNTIIYILRPSDAGDELYDTKRYAVKEQDTMPKYIMATDPKGSVADVKAKGVWRDGTWTLEESRLLNTGNSDDAVFKPGAKVAAAVGVFDHSESENHDISETIYFHFPQ